MDTDADDITLTLTARDRDDLSLVILCAIHSLGDASAAARAIGADVRGLDERRTRLRELLRLVLGGES